MMPDVREKTEHRCGPEDRRYLKFDRNSTSGPFPFSGTSPTLFSHPGDGEHHSHHDVGEADEVLPGTLLNARRSA